MRRQWALLTVLLLWGILSPYPAMAQEGTPQPEALVHIVQRGDTLFSIARRYGVTVEALSRANGIADPHRIFVGQPLTIPVGAVQSADKTFSYLVTPGDTLPSIAKRYGTTWEILARLNRMLSPNTLYSGLVIQVPLPTSTTESSPSSPSTRVPYGGIYLLRPRETLFALALRHGISYWEFVRLNQLHHPGLLYSGQILVVPGEGEGLLPRPFLQIDLQPLPVFAGQTIVVAVRTSEPVTLEGQAFDRPVRFGEEGGVYYGLIGVHTFTEPGLYHLELVASDEQGERTTLSTGFVVQPRRALYERIDVPATRSELLDPNIVAEERARLEVVQMLFTPQRLWRTPFTRPVAGTVSSPFGVRRAYEGGPYTSYHSGIDFRAPGGTPVLAAAAGTVVLAEPLAIHGNMVVIDHGWGVLTGYAHLSEIGVQAGQVVTSGEPIGRVGNTGLSTGNHLHWEVWVGGISVDGMQWLEELYPWPAPEAAVGG